MKFEVANFCFVIFMCKRKSHSIGLLEFALAIIKFCVTVMCLGDYCFLCIFRSIFNQFAWVLCVGAEEDEATILICRNYTFDCILRITREFRHQFLCFVDNRDIGFRWNFTGV